MPRGVYQQTEEYRKKRIQIFWTKIKKSSGNKCWLWTGAKFEIGYGAFGFAGKQCLTHRKAFEFSVGPIPDGVQVLHKCDNRACCRPSHLFLGSQHDNITDMHAKGRAPIGQTHGMAKITDDDVRAIRSEFKFRVTTYKMLGKKYGLHKAHVAKIVRREAWSHLD